MWLRPLIEAYEMIYWSLRQIGYEDQRADRATGWFTLLGILFAIWLVIEVITSLPVDRS